MYGSTHYGRMTLSDYLFKTPETNLPREVVWGVLREPPSPFVPHQFVVTRLVRLLGQHIERNDLGALLVSPLDVILDKTEQRPLVVQPDIVFVAKARANIIRNQIWGAPDLVVEVASGGTARRDRTTKLGWYKRYGVRECWLIEPQRQRVELINPTTPVMRRIFAGTTPIRSRVIGPTEISAEHLFLDL